ncbi:MAG: hypothetical protein Q9226_007618, partial [Calogaya cf. arnoldii]
ILYLKFGREVESFGENLQQLEAVINNANRQRPRRRYGNPDHDTRVALQPVSQAVGDFKTTLDECEKLLNDHDRFRRDTAGFVDNVVWHVSTQRDVEVLRERVQFHATKTPFANRITEVTNSGCVAAHSHQTLRDVSQPCVPQAFPILTSCSGLLLEIRRELQDLRRDVSEIKGFLVSLLRNEEPSMDALLSGQRLAFPEIPTELVDKFARSLTLNPPAAFQDVAKMPLKEGFDALVYHISQSTVGFNPGFDPSQRTPEETQFVNLLKSKWILDRMEQSSHLTAAGTAPLWISALAEVKSLVAPPKDVIVRLPDECFSIWVVEAPALVPPDLAEQRPLEDQILELNNVSWSINGSEKSHKTGKAMLQMWQPQSLPVPTEPLTTLPLTPIQSSASVTSPRSFSGSRASFAGSTNPSRRSTALSTSTTLFSGSSATSVMVGNRGNGTAVKTPEPPVIVFFTMYDGKYAFLHFKLTDHIYVDPERCYCRQNSRKPCRTVIIVTKDKTIDLRRFHASQESGKGLYTWDLARFRIPRHPQYNDVEVVKKVEYLTLEFDTVEGMCIFVILFQ